MNILTSETAQDRFLFRAICRGDNFHYGHLAQLPDDRGYGKKGDYCISNKANQPFAYPVTRPETIGQCTGLKDKNGKLIYEGDICKLWSDEWESIKEVIYKDCSFHFRKPNSMQADSPLYCYAIDYLGHFKHIDIKIIGNIYENKEIKL